MSLGAELLLGRANDETGQRLVDAWNAVEGKSIADCCTVGAQLIAQTLAEAPEDIRREIWRGYVEIVVRSAAMQGVPLSVFIGDS